MADSASIFGNHNLVSSLYAMKGLIESYLSSRKEGVLKKACGQAEQAIEIAKRLGDVVEPNGNGHVSDKVSIKRAWQAVLKLLGRQFADTQVEIIERIPERFPSISCNADDLKEILLNLCKNALEVMAGKGKLIIRVQLSFSTKEEPLALIQIADTGPGIPESKLSRLFLPFFTTKPWQEGNGLGLYLTRQLVLRNHGRISASSFTGCGTTFTLEFPLVAFSGSAR